VIGGMDLQKHFHLRDVPDIAFAVKLVRLANDLTQRDLAVKMHTSRTYISKIENSKCLPTFAGINRLAKALNATPDALILIGQAAILPSIA
jgi:transcriptional regulator with XRE-family HTH domain